MDHFKAKSICILNPIFGEASRAIGGADADLVIDDLLLDVKVRKTTEVRGPDFQALMGYYLLYRISGISGLQMQPPISRVGFYFARHCLFTSWNIADLVGSTPLTETIELAPTTS